jgi:hypothetical protein
MVLRVELRFEHVVHGKRKRSRFLDGVIHPQNGDGDSYDINCSKKRLLCRRARCRSASEPS